MGFLILIALLLLAFFAGRWYAESRLSASGASGPRVGDLAAAVHQEYPESAYLLEEVQRSQDGGYPLAVPEIVAELKKRYPRRVIGS